VRNRPALAAIVVAALLAAIVSVFLLTGGDGNAAAALRATPYPKAIPAPATLGRDQAGAPVQVPRAGRPAVVTFLFANCPDVCPLVAQEISQALDAAGPNAVGAIDVVAISVDPENDDRRSVDRFLEAHRLAGRMRYIVGTRDELAPMWRAWQVAAQPSGDITKSVHTARVVLIDREGRQLASYPGGIPFSPDDLAADIRTLTE
jgi:protein SCO1/2